jgi:peptidoglycan/LPS O-acetylase OafA/YrhL
VDLFFCLSGLVVVNSLERFSGQFWPFMAARARRLLPVYFVVLALSTWLLAAGDPLAGMPWTGTAAREFWAAGLPAEFWAQWWAHMFLVQSLIPQGVLPWASMTLLAPAWSLSTEWQFYVVLGLLAPRVRLARLALGLVAVGVVFHAVRWPEFWTFSRGFLPDAAPYFALGLGSAVSLRGGGPGIFWCCFGGACVAALAGGQPETLLVPVAWAFMLFVGLWHAAGEALDGRILQFFGAISYPLYLVNEPVQRALAFPLAGLAAGHVGIFTAMWLPLALTAPVLVAWALHVAVEKPFMTSMKNSRQLLRGRWGNA